MAHRPTVYHFCALGSISRLSEPIRLMGTIGHCPAGHDSNGIAGFRLAGSMSSEWKVAQNSPYLSGHGQRNVLFQQQLCCCFKRFKNHVMAVEENYRLYTQNVYLNPVCLLQSIRGSAIWGEQ